MLQHVKLDRKESDYTNWITISWLANKLLKTSLVNIKLLLSQDMATEMFYLGKWNWKETQCFKYNDYAF